MTKAAHKKMGKYSEPLCSHASGESLSGALDAGELVSPKKVASKPLLRLVPDAETPTAKQHANVACKSSLNRFFATSTSQAPRVHQRKFTERGETLQYICMKVKSRQVDFVNLDFFTSNGTVD